MLLSLAPVINTNSLSSGFLLEQAGLIRGTMMDERTIPECAFQEEVRLNDEDHS
jgi:hypothetical protein